MVYSGTNGFLLVFEMEGVDQEIPQCFLESDPDHPILAPFETIAYKEREYAESLWWDSIPMEMLYTPVFKPQVRVQVNGLDAVCPEQNCDYVYKADLNSDTGMRRNLVAEPSVSHF